MAALTEKVTTNLTKGRQPQGTQTKVVEDGGVCARNVLTKSNPFPREECGRNDCVMCSQREMNNHRMCCSQMNVGYEGECARCELKHTYIGETSRTAYTRIKEHLSPTIELLQQLTCLPYPLIDGVGVSNGRKIQNLGCGNIAAIAMVDRLGMGVVLMITNL